ncbi:MAG: hypothetical protein KatS3mg102_2599 [Planctomycetota bacterium]|nr:MAG: hypothetical protein KatS3mg102_2599 [Planctomycetota bacterium]
MGRFLLATERGLDALVLRLGLGAVMFPHGAQKALGLFGGAGIAGTVEQFAHLGIPTAAALGVIAAEFLGAIALVVGFLTRLAALGIAAVMAGAVWLVHLEHGFFMNWSGTRQGEGFEYHLLAIAIALALLVRGGGSASLDRVLAAR